MNDERKAEDVDGLWPIAKLTVGEDGTVSASLYTPGLPPGEHDMWPCPVFAKPGGVYVQRAAFDDVAGLVERLRHAQNDLSAYSVRAKRGLFKDAASALESLSARVAELTAERGVMLAAAEVIGHHMEGRMPTRGWLKDNPRSREALDNMLNSAAAIRQRAGRGADHHG
jgi:hypothetical protein